MQMKAARRHCYVAMHGCCREVALVVGEDVEKVEALYITSGNDMENTVVVPEKMDCRIATWSNHPSPGYTVYSKEL